METPEAGPEISIVIPVHNSSGTIAKCLDSLIRLTHPSFEVIIVDDGSTDTTLEICHSYPTVKVIPVPKGGPSRARNIGIAQSRGQFVAFTDGDCVVDRHWLDELRKGFLAPNVAGVGGDQVSPQDDTDTGKLIQAFLKTIGFVADYVKSGASLRPTAHNPSCNSMYRKEVLTECGAFNEELWPGEDVELDFKISRLGYTLMYNPAARVAHYRPSSYAKLARMFKRYGAGQGYLARKYGMFRPIHWVPLLIVLASLVLALLSWWSPWVLLSLLALPLGSFLWFTSVTRSWSTGLRFVWMLAIVLFSWDIGFVAAYFNGTRDRA
ncbi:MAG: glycosyltransferase [Thermodesulfobacteriota bacterium]